MTALLALAAHKTWALVLGLACRCPCAVGTTRTRGDKSLSQRYIIFRTRLWTSDRTIPPVLHAWGPLRWPWLPLVAIADVLAYRYRCGSELSMSSDRRATCWRPVWQSYALCVRVLYGLCASVRGRCAALVCTTRVLLNVLGKIFVVALTSPIRTIVDAARPCS